MLSLTEHLNEKNKLLYNSRLDGNDDQINKR